MVVSGNPAISSYCTICDMAPTLLRQVYISAPGDSLGDSALQNNVTMPVTITVLIETYGINPPWIAVGVFSCAALLVGGVLSVTFRHMAAGPEVLGYASTIIQDSNYIDLPSNIGGINGLDITKMMKKQRLRYGFTDLTSEDQLLVGVGLEEDTARIKDNARVVRDEQGINGYVKDSFFTHLGNGSEF
ncbi:hypothetical protein SCAR479_02522 [Seiridium cardinale]|uniref:Uncharacterized protein n=1 Tax=Seiridium cardinale TaxID=138064 RepID=A0ABR2Y343_9PEZI